MSKRSGICRIICNSAPTLMHTAASTILHSRWAQEHSKRCRIYYPHTWVLLDYKRYLSGTIRLLAGTLSPRSVLLCSRNRCRAKRCCSEFFSLFSLLFSLQDWICWHLWSCIVITNYGLCHKLNKLNAQYCNVSRYWAWARQLLINNIKKKKAKLIQSSKIHCPDRGTCPPPFPMPMPSPIKKVDQSDYCCQAEGILKDIFI